MGRACPQYGYNLIQAWPSFQIKFGPLPYIFLELINSIVSSLWPCNCSGIYWIWTDGFFPLPQLQHCLPVYLLLSRAHSQSSGGTQHREPPPAPHHKLSGPAPPGSPGALFNWTEGCTQEPFWQGEEAPTKSSVPSQLSLCSSLLQYTKHLFYSWTHHQTLTGNTSASKAF